MSSSSKRIRIFVLVAVLLYGLLNVALVVRNSDAAPKTFSFRYKLNQHPDSIDLKTHGQVNSLSPSSSITALSASTKHINSLPSTASLREQLAFQFPYEPHKPIPRFIWQTWKVDFSDKKFPNNFKHLVNRWGQLNPDFVHKLVPDAACHEQIRTLYQSVPDVLRAYEAMPHPILKADFYRYLIVFARGGVYSDIDTFNLKHVSSWPSYADTVLGKKNNVGLVVGIEADPDRPDWADWYARRIQFCQWTIQGKRGHPLLGALITKITEITLDRLEKGTLKLAKGDEQGADIMNWTGPGIFTDEIFNYLNNVATNAKKAGHPPADYIVNNNVREKEPENGLKDPNLDKIENAKLVNWKLFTGMDQPILIDDVLVLPITSFSPGVGQMGAKDESDELAFVKHMFEGSWKNDKKPPARNENFNPNN